MGGEEGAGGTRSRLTGGRRALGTKDGNGKFKNSFIINFINITWSGVDDGAEGETFNKVRSISELNWIFYKIQFKISQPDKGRQSMMLVAWSAM